MRKPLIKEPHFLTEKEQITIDIGGEDEVDMSFSKLTLPGRKVISALSLLDKYPQLPLESLHDRTKSEKINRDKEGIDIYKTEDNRIVKTWNSFKGIPKEKFCREIIVGLELNKLNSPYFVKTLGYIREKNNVHLYLEKIEGITLRKYYLENGDIRTVFNQIVKALCDAHQKFNFTHYDLHVNNILIRNDGTPVIIDFDLSHISLEDGDIGENELSWACYNDRSMWTQDIFKLCGFIWYDTNHEFIKDFANAIKGEIYQKTKETQKEDEELLDYFIRVKDKLEEKIVEELNEDFAFLEKRNKYINSEIVVKNHRFVLEVLQYLYPDINDEWMANSRKSFNCWRSYPTPLGEISKFSDFVQYIETIL